MLKYYFVVATLLNTGDFAPTPTTTTTSSTPVPLKQFDNIAYEINKNAKEDFVKVYKTFTGYSDGFIESDLDVYYPNTTTLALKTPMNAGGVYILTWKTPRGIHKDYLLVFTLNETKHGESLREAYSVEGDKLIDTLVFDDKTLKTTWEFSEDQVIETLESGDAKATRIWKVEKPVKSKQ